MPSQTLPDLHALVDPLIDARVSYDDFVSQYGRPGEDGCYGLVRHLYTVGLQVDLEADPEVALRQLVEIWGPRDPRDPLTLVQPWDAYILATAHPWSDHVGVVMDALTFVNVRRRTGVVRERLHTWRPKLVQLARLRMLM